MMRLGMNGKEYHISTMIVNNILSGKDGAVDGYIEFLKCGSRKSPI